jgi:hypothetical protein
VVVYFFFFKVSFLENLDSRCCLDNYLCCSYKILIIVSRSFVFFVFLLQGCAIYNIFRIFSCCKD